MAALPPIDEGKVSVSIDFGERRPSLSRPNPRACAFETDDSYVHGSGTTFSGVVSVSAHSGMTRVGDRTVCLAGVWLVAYCCRKGATNLALAWVYGNI